MVSPARGCIKSEISERAPRSLRGDNRTPDGADEIGIVIAAAGDTPGPFRRVDDVRPYMFALEPAFGGLFDDIGCFFEEGLFCFSAHQRHLGQLELDEGCSDRLSRSKHMLPRQHVDRTNNIGCHEVIASQAGGIEHCLRQSGKGLGLSPLRKQAFRHGECDRHRISPCLNRDRF
ncbi:hypothetical protein pRL100458 (plasmid) [Rhizobium johnstonii 3841]|uniref:Uncharacterized protein n=1 Tax=Rhizobium johnstonii (strain DSM 114642 / LMG 32736 / 3841) TaxID=216596 RepID=Q1M749_RHIJ3|nr:hypothetical protein pRL100458 [Rhizobium johnstonii 3841]